MPIYAFYVLLKYIELKINAISVDNQSQKYLRYKEHKA
jgi:hypothetical protein